MPLFTDGVVADAQLLNSLHAYVLKTADESVTSNATVQNDDHLLYVLPATGTYEVVVKLWASSAANAAGDLRVGFSFPTGTMHVGGIGPDSSLASGSASTSEHVGILSTTSGSSVTNLGYGLSTTTNLIVVHGLLIATATGTLRLQWAQITSNANASTVKAGSHMLIRRVA